MENIVKKYGSLVANNNISLSLEKGEILAVIGENGAGKTTLMKVLYGLEEANSGSIYINEKKVDIKNPNQAIQNKIGMVQQHFMLFEPFTVTENIVYGKEPVKWGFFDLEQANREVGELSEKYQLHIDPKRKIHDMPVGLKQRVEILKILYQNSDIIIFDEPTAVLTPQEVKELLKTMNNLKEMGKSIIIITHKLKEVMTIADRALVMKAGEQVSDVYIKDTTSEELSFLMVGRHLIDHKLEDNEIGNKVIEVTNLTLKNNDNIDVLKDLSLHVNAGEIVGIAGVSGNGQSELVECLFGLKKADSGKIEVLGKDLFNKKVQYIREHGVSLVPEDRNVCGMAAEATLSEAAIMGHYRNSEFSKRGFLKLKKIRDFTQQIIQEFKVKADSSNQTAGSLSGGNAQKLIVAREIKHESPFLIAAEPTRGVDVGALEFIHDKLIEKRSNGDAILLVSSELTEIMKLSDRIYVMYEGEINGEFMRDHVVEEELGILMAGGTLNVEK